VFVRRRDGQLVRVIRTPRSPTAVTSQLKIDYAAYRRTRVEQFNGGPLPADQRARLEQAIARTVYPDLLPALGALLVDPGGNLWARRYDFREAMTVARVGRGEGLPSVPTPQFASTWDVFGPDGRWLTTVTMPERFSALDIGRDYVAGLERDADDVEMVRVYKLIKP
jgi:hypothetical protein